MKSTIIAFTVFALLLLAAGAPAQEDFCCEHHGLFLPIEMPVPEQERDCTNMISCSVYEVLRYEDILDCPLEYGQWSWEGRELVNWLINAMGEAEGVPVDPEMQQQFRKYRDCEFLWIATLALDNMEEAVEGYWEEGYAGEPYYQQGYVYGDWTLNLKLVNAQYGDLVKEGTVSYNGSCSGLTDNSVKDMVRNTFNPVDDLIYDYEQIPMSCEIELEEDSIEAGTTVTIKIKDLKDDQGRAPREWQRVVIGVEQGEIKNGVRCDLDGRKYAFLANDGTIDVEYTADQRCEEATEIFTVYNSCTWGQTDARPMHLTSWKKLLNQEEVKIYDRNAEHCEVAAVGEPIEAGTVATIHISNITDDALEPAGEHERIMVKAKRGEIVNGMPVDDYKVFECGDGDVKVLFEAKNDCGFKDDTIIVRQACLEGDEFVRIVPGDEIERAQVDIGCEYMWAGRISIERLERLNCEDSDSDEFHRLNYHENLSNTQRAFINIKSDADQPDDVTLGLIMITSDMEITGHFFAQHDEHQKTVNIHTGLKRKTTILESSVEFNRSSQISNKNVVLEMMREKDEMKDMGEQMTALAEQAATGTIDPEEVEKWAEQVTQSLSTEGQSSVPVTVVVLLFGEWNLPVEYWNYAESSDKGITQDEKHFTDGTTTFGMKAEITATYSRGDNGRVSIAGNNSKIEKSPHGIKSECPDTEITTTSNINLSSHRMKDH